jgi:hypothetical protein
MNRFVSLAPSQTLDQSTLALVGGIIATFERVEQAVLVVCETLVASQTYRFPYNREPNKFCKRLGYLRQCLNAPGPLKRLSPVGKRILKEFDLKDARTFFAHSVIERVYLSELGIVAEFVRLKKEKGGVLIADRKRYDEAELRGILHSMKKAARLAEASQRYLQRKGIVCILSSLHCNI